MSETQVLLTRIADLRQRLEQAYRPAKDAGAVAKPGSEGQFTVLHLERQLTEGSKQTVLLGRALRESRTCPANT